MKIFVLLLAFTLSPLQNFEDQRFHLVGMFSAWLWGLNSSGGEEEELCWRQNSWNSVMITLLLFRLPCRRGSSWVSTERGNSWLINGFNLLENKLIQTSTGAYFMHRKIGLCFQVYFLTQTITASFIVNNCCPRSLSHLRCASLWRFCVDASGLGLVSTLGKGWTRHKA